MAPAIALIPMLASAIGVTGANLAIISAFSMFASYAIQRSQMPGAPDPQAITRNVKSPVSPRRILYGKRRVGGTIVYAGTTGDDNYLHMMVAIAGHKVQSITDVYMNDKKLSDYNNVGQKQKVWVTWDGEGLNQDAFSVTINAVSTYSGTIQEIVTALKIDGYTSSGAYTESTVGDHNEESWNARLSISPPKVDDVISVDAASGAVNYRNTGSTVLYRVNTHLGESDQLADADAVNEIPEWTTDHRLRGIAYIYVRIRYERESFPTGVPNITALVEGKEDIYDPRSGGSYAYTDNAALCTADYLHSGMFGFGANYGSDISITELISSANACDELVTLSDASTEPRYTCNGVVDTSQTPKDNLANMLTSMSGSCVFVGGQWRFYAGVYHTPQVSLDEGDLREGLKIQTKRSRANICNGVKGTYIYANDDESSYQPADFPSITNAMYRSEDDGVDIWKDISLSYTTSSSMAQRIAKIELEKTRQGITFKYPAKLSALGVTTGDTVSISNAHLQWTAKPFEVLDWEFSISDSGVLGIDLTLQETASGIYDWANGEETSTDLAKNSNLPNPGYVAPVTGLAVSETAVINNSGAEVINVTLTWDASASAQVDHYEVEGIPASATDDNWVSWTTSGTIYQVDGVVSGRSYFARVRAVSIYGAKSQWETVGFYSDGIDETPLPPSDLAILPTVDMLTATWTNNAAPAWMRGTNIYAATTNDRSDVSFGLVTSVGGDAARFSHSVASGTTYYYWVATVNKNGQTSDFHPVSATGGISGTALTGGGLSQEQSDIIDGLTDVTDNLVYDPSEKRVSLNPWYDALERFSTSSSEAASFGLEGEPTYIEFVAAAVMVGEYMEEIFDVTVTGGGGGFTFEYDNLDNPSYFPTYAGTKDPAGNDLTFTRDALNTAWETYYHKKNVLDSLVGGLLTLTQQAEIETLSNNTLELVTNTGEIVTDLPTIDFSVNNFNTRNDRIGTTPADPVIAGDGTAIDFSFAPDGSCTVDFDWAYDGNGDAYNIDGFVIYGVCSISPVAADLTIGDINVTHVFIAADARRTQFLSVPSEMYFTIGIQAYRVVDQDINADGVLRSNVIQPTFAGENPIFVSRTVPAPSSVTVSLA